jgi:hypothetical protein
VNRAVRKVCRIARKKMAVATALNGTRAARSASVAIRPSGDAGGYAESGVGNVDSSGLADGASMPQAYPR